jgi:hypothetical protein
MSLYLGVVRKVEALRDPASVLFDLHAELEAARAAYQEQCRLWPNARSASSRRRWPERIRFVCAEKAYVQHLREVQAGRAW